MEPNRNPLYLLGNYTWGDYANFKAHLRLPSRYLRVIFKNYPRLTDAVLQLDSIIRLTNTYDWEKLMIPTIQDKLFRAANIPPLFFADKMVITVNSKDQVDFEWLCDHAPEAKGETFYFWSEFSEGAMAAAFQIVKSAKLKHVACYCTSFPELLSDLKEGWDTKSALQTHVRKDELVVIYAIGGEYSTEFTANQLQEVLMTRSTQGLVTILCSSLTPRDYVARYKCQPEGVEIGFRDQKIKKTLAQLKEELQR